MEDDVSTFIAIIIPATIITIAPALNTIATTLDMSCRSSCSSAAGGC